MVGVVYLGRWMTSLPFFLWVNWEIAHPEELKGCESVCEPDIQIDLQPRWMPYQSILIPQTSRKQSLTVK